MLSHSDSQELIDTPSAHDSEYDLQRRAPPRELLFKFLVVGDFGVGKTAIVKRYTEGRFSSSYKITIGADFAIKQLLWDPDHKINLQLWDIAGHERFGCMTRVYYKYAVAAAVVFDLSRITTFQSVQKWVTDIREKVTLPDGSPIPLVLLANKCDVPDVVVPVDSISSFCKKHGIEAWYTTSAKDNINVEDAMKYLVQQVLKLKPMNINEGEHIVLQESNDSDCATHGFGTSSKNSLCTCG